MFHRTGLLVIALSIAAGLGIVLAQSGPGRPASSGAAPTASNDASRFLASTLTSDCGEGVTPTGTTTRLKTRAVVIKDGVLSLERVSVMRPDNANSFINPVEGTRTVYSVRLADLQPDAFVPRGGWLGFNCIQGNCVSVDGTRVLNTFEFAVCPQKYQRVLRAVQTLIRDGNGSPASR
jgi:hypothetical protein